MSARPDLLKTREPEFNPVEYRTFNVPITPGKRKIRIGTDQSSLCGDDLAIWRMTFKFNGPCLAPDDLL